MQDLWIVQNSNIFIELKNYFKINQVNEKFYTF